MASSHLSTTIGRFSLHFHKHARAKHKNNRTYARMAPPSSLCDVQEHTERLERILSLFCNITFDFEAISDLFRLSLLIILPCYYKYTSAPLLKLTSCAPTPFSSTLGLLHQQIGSRFYAFQDSFVLALCLIYNNCYLIH